MNIKKFESFEGGDLQANVLAILKDIEDTHGIDLDVTTGIFTRDGKGGREGVGYCYDENMSIKKYSDDREAVEINVLTRNRGNAHNRQDHRITYLKLDKSHTSITKIVCEAIERIRSMDEDIQIYSNHFYTHTIHIKEKILIVLP